MHCAVSCTRNAPCILREIRIKPPCVNHEPQAIALRRRLDEAGEALAGARRDASVAESKCAVAEARLALLQATHDSERAYAELVVSTSSACCSHERSGQQVLFNAIAPKHI